MFESPENGLQAELRPLGLPRCRSKSRKMGLLYIRIGQLMSIDILAREISITFLEPVTPQNPMDVTEGEISIGLARAESATSIAKTRFWGRKRTTETTSNHPKGQNKSQNAAETHQKPD